MKREHALMKERIRHLLLTCDDLRVPLKSPSQS